MSVRFPFRDDVFLSCDQVLEFYTSIFSPSLENEQADAGPDGRMRLARPNSQAQAGKDRDYFFYCPADDEQDWQPHPRLIHILCYLLGICDHHAYSLIGIRITTTTVLVALSPSPLSSTNEDQRLNKKCPGETWKIQTNPALKHKFHVFCETEHPQKHPTLR